MEQIDQLIAEYQPSDETIALLRGTPLALIVGITGAGKDTLQKELLKTGEFTKIITSTTREPRLNDGVMEKDGEDYYFFTMEQAVRNLQEKRYFEVAKVHQRINGSTSDEIRRLHDSGLTAIGDVDYQGAAYYKKYSPATTLIFVVPPTYDEWLRRIHHRYITEQEFNEALPERMRSAVRELAHVLETDVYHVVINDDLETAVEAVRTIIAEPGSKTTKDDKARLVARELLSGIADRLS